MVTNKFHLVLIWDQRWIFICNISRNYLRTCFCDNYIIPNAVRNYLLMQKCCKKLPFCRISAIDHFPVFAFYFPFLSTKICKHPHLNTNFQRRKEILGENGGKKKGKQLKERRPTLEKEVYGRHAAKGSFLQHFSFNRQFLTIYFYIRQVFVKKYVYKIVSQYQNLRV